MASCNGKCLLGPAARTHHVCKPIFRWHAEHWPGCCCNQSSAPSLVVYYDFGFRLASEVPPPGVQLAEGAPILRVSPARDHPHCGFLRWRGCDSSQSVPADVLLEILAHIVVAWAAEQQMVLIFQHDKPARLPTTHYFFVDLCVGAVSLVHRCGRYQISLIILARISCQEKSPTKNAHRAC